MRDRWLFKAKFDDSDRWKFGSLYEQNGIYFIMPKETGGVIVDGMYASSFFVMKVKEETICQCTGLKDKNGKLIWENDIVDFLGHKGKVMYECGSFGIAYRECIDWEEIESNICSVTGCDNALYACENDNYISLWEIYWNFNDEEDCLSTVEVIGNIFDNPELLEQ